MPNIREIRDRIRSVNDTRKITNAMYMISSNKLLRARKSHEQTLPFFRAIRENIEHVARHLPPETESIYLKSYEELTEKEKTRGFLVITDDKGLAGAFNHNILKLATDLIQEHEGGVRLYVVGEVGRHYFRNLGMPIEEAFVYTAQNPTLSRARHISEVILDGYESGAVQEFTIVYSEPLSSMGAKALSVRMLPLDLLMSPEGDDALAKDADAGLSYKLEPDAATLLQHLVPDYIVGFVYGCLVESYCAAQSSRMAAMDQANRNASEMLQSLETTYNRERQAVITQEITEIAAGAKALKAAKEKEPVA